MKDIELNMKTISKVLIAHKLTIVSQQIISMRNNGLIICQTRFPLWWRLQKILRRPWTPPLLKRYSNMI